MGFPIGFGERAVAGKEFVHDVQQPLTALRLMVEALQNGFILHSPEVHGNLLDCLTELQGCVNALSGVAAD